MKLAYYTAGRFPDIDWKKKITIPLTQSHTSIYA